MKLKPLMVILLLASHSVWATCSYQSTNPIILNNQKMVNEFIQSLSGDFSRCDYINYHGSITVSGKDIDDLSPLSKLEYEQLTVDDNPSLKALSGLAGVNFLEYLRISNNPLLENLSGLDVLNEIKPYPSMKLMSAQGNNLEIVNNANLTNLHGLGFLLIVESSILIQDNPKLSSLSGMDSFQGLHGSLTISHNDALVDFKGLNSEIAIGGGLEIIGNKSLQTLDGSSFETDSETIPKDVLVIENPLLVSISALSSVDFFVQRVNVSGNTKLTSLDGLQNLKSATGLKTQLFLDNQPALKDCSQICPLWVSSNRNAPKELNNACVSQLQHCSGT
ncbi:MAG: hypothetical protein ACPGUD_04335 [Parashewanella sp.]